MNVLSIEGLTVDFNTAEGQVRAVDNVSFVVPENRTVALVGESGSGKTVISQTIMGLLPQAASITSGKVILADPTGAEPPVDIAALERKGPQMRHLRGNRVAIVGSNRPCLYWAIMAIQPTKNPRATPRYRGSRAPLKTL